MTDGERRRQLRVEDASVIRYRVAGVGDPGPYRFRAAVTGNLSSGGVLLRTFVAHEPGTVLDLEILLRPSGESIVCRHAVFQGRVVRCTPVAETTCGGNGGYEVGVAMEGLSDEDRRLLGAYLSESADGTQVG